MKRSKKSDIWRLLEERPESYYWLGFLTADGSCTDNRLSLTLGNKDKDHLERFMYYVNYTGERKDNSWSAKDVEVVPQLLAKLDWNKQKTYHPPSYEKYKDWILYQKISFVVGFIDGDGSISDPKDRMGYLRIKTHHSWTNFLFDIFSDLKRELKLTGCIGSSQTKNGYYELRISDSESLKRLKVEAINLGLPILKRKWDRIDLNYVSRSVSAKNRVELVKKFLNEGISQKEMARRLNMSDAGISLMIKRNSLK